MNFIFSKLSGAGNDFVVVDHDNHPIVFSAEDIELICDRKRGIGADGFILISSETTTDSAQFRMRIFNCDGSEAEMCGNGLRCAAVFCSKRMKGCVSGKTLFETEAGVLASECRGSASAEIEIPLLEDFSRVELDGETLFRGNTGVPHVIKIVDDLDDYDVIAEGRYIRNHEFFAPEGTNVNFISLPQADSSSIGIRTYERGVEGETSACGTGAAAAGVCAAKFFARSSPLEFITKGGDTLSVALDIADDSAPVDTIRLTGPVEEVFTGVFVSS